MQKSVGEKSKECETKGSEVREKVNADDSANKRFVYITIGALCLYAIIVNLTKDGLTTWVPSILKEEFEISDALSILLTLMLPVIAVFGNLASLKIHKKIPDYVTHCLVVFVVIGVFVGAIIASISVKQVVLTLIGLVVVNFFASSLNSLITSVFPMFMREKVNSGLFAGVLNGFCYIGSTISAYGIGAVADRFGWIAVFYLLIGCCVLACVVWCIQYSFKNKIRKQCIFK